MSDQLLDKIVEVAARNLRVSGCKYIIVKPDGETLSEGELELATKKRRSNTKVHSFMNTGYVDIIGAMQPGDRYTFDPLGDYDAKQFQKVISARCYEVFGTGNYTTTVVGNQVQVMCLGMKE